MRVWVGAGVLVDAGDPVAVGVGLALTHCPVAPLHEAFKINTSPAAQWPPLGGPHKICP